MIQKGRLAKIIKDSFSKPFLKYIGHKKVIKITNFNNNNNKINSCPNSLWIHRPGKTKTKLVNSHI